MKTFLALLKIDLKLVSRNRVAVFFNFLFPLIFFFMFAQLYGAGQGKIILYVVSMVTVIGILGNGLFGAGMRAVQDREENILRRYKVTPITPVPLLLASMITGIIIYLPTVIVILVLANRLYGMAIPPNLVSLFLFVCLGSFAFRAIGLIVAARLHANAFLKRRHASAFTFPRLAPGGDAIHSRDLSHERDRRNFAARRIARAKLEISPRTLARSRCRIVYCEQNFPLGKGRETAALGEIVGDRRAAAFFSPRRLRGAEPPGVNQNENFGARSPARADLADPERAHLRRQWQGDRVGRRAR
jgi:ABC-type transport system involved in cytochrome c biogenesis permease component